MTNIELQAKISELKSLQRLSEEVAADMEAIKDTVKAYMGADEVLRAGEYRVTYKAVKSSRLDTAALKQALPDVVARFSKETVTRRFCVA